MPWITHALKRWREAGLIDAATCARIQAWEAAQARPAWLWAVAALGGFALALGLAAIVAANWAAIPDPAKLAAHLGLDAALAAATYVAWRRLLERLRELLALVLFGAILSGIGLIGQLYQLGATTWEALLAWMVVCTPFLALLTRSGLLALAWCLGAAATFGFGFADVLAWTGEPAGLTLAWSFCLAVLAGGLLRERVAEEQGATLQALAGAGLLGVASLPSVLLRLGVQAGGGPALAATSLGLAVLATLPLGTDAPRWRWRSGFLGACWLAWWLTVLAGRALPRGGRDLGSEDVAQFAGALIFLALWGGIAWLALRSGRRGMFGLAFSVVALRVALLYWEALGTLLATGLGLILGGALCIALAALGWRLARHDPAQGPTP